MAKTDDKHDHTIPCRGEPGAPTQGQAGCLRRSGIESLPQEPVLVLDDAEFEGLEALLANPPRANAHLKRLFATNSPWES